MESQSESMVKKTLIYLAGNFSSKIFSLIIIPIYATYLTANQLGKYDYQQTIAGLLQPIIALALWEAVLRFGLNAKGKELKRILSTSAIISGATISLSAILLLFIYKNIYGFNIITILYIIMIVFVPILNLLGYMARATHHSMVYAFSGVVSSGVNLLGIILFVVIGNKGLLGLLLSTIIANFFNAIFLIIGSKLPRYISRKYFSINEGKRLLAFSIPLILNLFFGWFISSFSRFYINTAIGDTENGIYAFASKFSMIIMQVSQIINMTMIEDAVQTAGSKGWVERFEQNITIVTNLFFRITFVCLPLIGIYYHTIQNEDFSKSLTLVPFLIFSTIMSNSATLVGNIFPVFNKTSKVFITTLFAGLINVALALIFGNYFGITGVIIAQIFGAIAMFLSRYFYGQRIKSYQLKWRQLVLNSALFIIISYLVVQRNIIVQISLFVLSSVAFLYLYKEWILEKITKRK